MPDINHYKLSDITEYINCPHRYVLNKTENDLQLITDIYKEVATFYFAKKLLDKNVTFDKLYKYFNTVWAQHRAKFTKHLKIDALSSLAYPIKSIYNILEKGDIVIAVQYDSFIEIENTIIHANIDAIIYNKIKNVTTLVYIPESCYSSSSSSDHLYIIAYLTILVKQLDFLMHKRNIQVAIFIPSSNYYSILPVSNIEKHKELLLSPTNGIKNGIFYPVSNKQLCNKCLFSKNCDWKSK